MIDIEKYQNQVKKFKEEMKKIDLDKENVQKEIDLFNSEKEEFVSKYKNIINGSSDNPFDTKEKEEEEKILLAKSKDIDSYKENIKNSESDLNSEFQQFITEFKDDIRAEKLRIQDEAKESSIGKLEEEKTKLLEDKDMYEARVKGWEENNINPNDSIYKHIKDSVIPKTEEKIADIDKQIEELKPENLRKYYKQLEDIDNILNNQHIIKYRLDELTEVLGIEEGQDIEEEPKEEEPQERKNTDLDKKEENPDNTVVNSTEPKEENPDNAVVNSTEQKKENQNNVILNKTVSRNEYVDNLAPKKQEQALNNNLKITIGEKGAVILYSNKMHIINISNLKNMDNSYGYKKINKFFSDALGKDVNLTKEQMNDVDTYLLSALRHIEYKDLIPKQQYIDIVEEYLDVITNQEKDSTNSNLKDIVQYDRTNLDYLKPSNILKRIIHKEAYDNIRYCANFAKRKGIATIKEDEPGTIRKFLLKIVDKVPLLSTSKNEMIDRTKEYTDDKKAPSEGTVDESKKKRTNFVPKVNVPVSSTEKAKRADNKERANAFATHVTIEDQGKEPND